MVACNMSFRDAAVMVRHSDSAAELVDRFHMFAGLLQIDTPAELKLFGKACGLRVSCVDVPDDALTDTSHPLHFLTKDLQGP